MGPRPQHVSSACQCACEGGVGGAAQCGRGSSQHVSEGSRQRCPLQRIGAHNGAGRLLCFGIGISRSRRSLTAPLVIQASTLCSSPDNSTHSTHSCAGARAGLCSAVIDQHNTHAHGDKRDRQLLSGSLCQDRAPKATYGMGARVWWAVIPLDYDHTPLSVHPE